MLYPAAGMKKDFEHINVEFHNRAQSRFASLYKEFSVATSDLNRKNDEYIFQKTREQYVNRLHQELVVIAEQLIASHRSYDQLDKVNHMLQHFISDYVREFVNKVRSD
jgi:hypothetical protein